MSFPRLLLALLAAAAMTAALPLGAGAVVPPKNCGKLTLKGKHYQVKVDQISCGAGRDYVKAYGAHHRKPKGYTCQNYKEQKDRVRFYCSSGRKVFFAIRR